MESARDDVHVELAMARAVVRDSTLKFSGAAGVSSSADSSRHSSISLNRVCPSADGSLAEERGRRGSRRRWRWPFAWPRGASARGHAQRASLGAGERDPEAGPRAPSQRSSASNPHADAAASSRGRRGSVWRVRRLVPQKFADEGTERAFIDDWRRRRIPRARLAVIFCLVPVLFSAGIYGVGVSRGAFTVEAAFSQSRPEVGATSAAALVACVALALGLASSARSLLRRHWQVSATLAMMIIYASSFASGRVQASATSLLVGVLFGSLLSSSVLGLHWAGVLAANGTGAALCLALALAFHAAGHRQLAWSTATSVPACFSAVLFATAAAAKDEILARVAFRKEREREAQVRSVRASYSHLASEIESFRLLVAALDVSSPVASAVALLSDTFEGLLRDGSVEHARGVATAVRHLLGTASARPQGRAPGLAWRPSGRASSGSSSRTPTRPPSSATGSASRSPRRGHRPLRRLRTLRQLRRRACGAGGEDAGERDSRGGGAGPVPRALAEALSGELADAVERAASEQWDAFDGIQLERAARGRPLEILATELARRAGLLEPIQADLANFRAFAAAIEAEYRAVPYHSSSHAADVVQAMHFLVAAVIHDVCHCGRNNHFEIATQSEVALLYNDQSVLENHSLARAFALLRDPAMDFLTGISRERRADFRRTVVAAVLATDMAHHFAKLSEFKVDACPPPPLEPTPPPSAPQSRVIALALEEGERRQQGQEGPGAGAKAEGVPRQLSYGAATALALAAAAAGEPDRCPAPLLRRRPAPLHLDGPQGDPPSRPRPAPRPWPARRPRPFRAQVADISNAGRPYYQHTEWSGRVTEEFFQQGDEERRLGLPVSPFCDRAACVPSTATAGFVSFLAAPLFAAWASRFPAAQPLVDHAASNLAHWRRETRPAAAPRARLAARPAPAPPPARPPRAPGAGAGAGRRLLADPRPRRRRRAGGVAEPPAGRPRGRRDSGAGLAVALARAGSPRGPGGAAGQRAVSAVAGLAESVVHALEQRRRRRSAAGAGAEGNHLLTPEEA
eukprot:tig00021017_g17207.t1